MNPLTCLLALALPFLSAGDPPEWGGFRGNNGAGLASSSSLPDALDPEANILWRTELPAGYSSPVVSGEDVFVTGAEGSKLVAMCLDRANGLVNWQRELEFDGRRPGQNSPAAPTPVTDGERVFFLFHHFGMLAFDRKGEELWRLPMGPFKIPHGLSTSPLLHDGLLILQVDQDLEAYLVAIDAATGKEKWRTDRPGVTHSYATPALYTPDGKPAQVIVSGSFQIAGYDLASGEKLWWVDGAAWQTKSLPVVVGNQCFVNSYMVSTGEFGVPRMTQTWAEVLEERDLDGDEHISKDEWISDAMHQAWFLFDLDRDGLLDEEDYGHAVKTGSSTGALFAIRLDGKGDVTGSHVAWRYDERRGLPDAPSPLALGGALFMIKEGGLLTSMDLATGEIVKQGRVGKPDPYFASPIAAGDKIVTASRSGQLSVIRGGAEWEVLSTHELGEDVWSTPAIAGDQVFVRSMEALYCFQDLSDD